MNRGLMEVEKELQLLGLAISPFEAIALILEPGYRRGLGWIRFLIEVSGLMIVPWLKLT